MADTGREPDSDKNVRMWTAARMPPHCPLEQVAIKLDLKENAELGKWFSKSASAGPIEWLNSGLSITYASACLIRFSKTAKWGGFAVWV